jgi:hypothetical protein
METADGAWTEPAKPLAVRNGEGSPTAVPPTSAERTLCAQCLQAFPVSELCQRDGRHFCAACLDRQRLANRPASLLDPSQLSAHQPGWRRVLDLLLAARIPFACGRVAIYLAAFTLLSPAGDTGQSVFLAFLFGIFAADNLTWLMFRTIELPEALIDYPFEVLITLGGGIAIISWQGLIPIPDDPYAMGLAFPAFLVTIAVKTFAWELKRIGAEFSDG